MFTLPKQEHLCSQKLIDRTYGGRRLMVFPFSIHWCLCPTEELPYPVTAQVLVSTGKKKFHHAVDRNRVKRLLRECYRLHKPQLFAPLEGSGLSLLIAVNYIHNRIFDYSVLSKKFDKATNQIVADITAALENKKKFDELGTTSKNMKIWG